MSEQRFGRYVVKGELGRGAMGTVFRAVDPLIEREVAVKTLHPDLPKEVLEEVRERFVREAKSAGRLNHPNVVTIYDVGEVDGVAYIAMELLVGRSLQDMLREDPRMPHERVAELVAQVAEGLDHAHSFGVVHRDVKPANIVVGPTGRAKLTDFGVAHVASSSMTQTGATIGSPKYMSPEQVLGQPVAPNSDIFSLGSVLYEMLTGRTPFVREGDTNVFSLMHRIAGEAHVPVTKVDARIHAAFDQILAKALAKKPAERYQRAEEMARDLRNFKALGATSPPTAAAAAAERTQMLSRAAAAAADGDRTVKLDALPGRDAQSTTRMDASTSQLLADVDSFAKSFEQQEQERIRAEHAERARKEEELRRWGEEEEKRREAFEREREASTSGTQTAARKSAALEILRQKAASRPAADDRKQKLELAAKIDSRLRAAFQYLSEFVVVLNDAHPVSERPFGVMYFGDVRGVILGDGFTDSRMRHVEGKDVIDHVAFKFKVRFPKPRAVEVTGQELTRVRERLQGLRIPFEAAEQKNEFGQVQRARLSMTGPFPCQAILRGDYDRGGFLIELTNLRRFGAVQARLGADDLTDDLLDQFGTYVLGADDGFERILRKR
jgi:serine/threonine-protein kinase